MKRLDGVYSAATHKIAELSHDPEVRRKSKTLLLIALVIGIGVFFASVIGAKAAITPVNSVGHALPKTTPHYSREQEPTFAISTGGIVKQLVAKSADNKFEAESGQIEVILYDPQHNPVELDPQHNPEGLKATIAHDGADDHFTVSLPALQDLQRFRPGKYQLEVGLKNGGEEQALTQDFYWGVLAMNLDRSTYKVDQEATIGMAVLNDGGVTQCGADVTLEIRGPSGEKQERTTKDGTIKIGETCQDKLVTNLPDYYTSYTPKESGQYQLNLSADFGTGPRTMSETFEVTDIADFVVHRHDTSMRIYPKSGYSVHTTIEANKDFTGTIIEKVPSVFAVSEAKLEIAPKGQAFEEQKGLAFSEQEQGETSTLSWSEVELKKGEQAEISYYYDAPDISPEFYLLGPLELKPNQPAPPTCLDETTGQVSVCPSSITNPPSSAYWLEPRAWQIASDETGSASGARLWTSGAELQSVTAGVEFSTVVGTPTINTSTKRSGAASVRVNAGGDFRYSFKSANTPDGFYARAYVNITTAPITESPLISFGDSSDTLQTSIYINTDNSLKLCNIEDDATCASPVMTYTALSTGTWYRIELKEDSTTLVSTRISAKVNGVTLTQTGSCTNNNGDCEVSHANGVTQVYFGLNSGNEPDLYFDDMAINDDSTTDVANGNWPGEGRVGTIRPNGVVAGNTWKNQAGTLCSAPPSPTCDTLLDDTPPDDATYVEIPGTGAASAIDLNMTDYSSMSGTASTDVVRLVQGNYRTQNGGGGANNRSMLIMDGANTDTSGAESATNGVWNTNNLGGASAVANPVVSSYDRPGTGTTHVYPWTPTTIDSLQARITTTDVAPDPAISEVWVNVEYISATGGRLYTSGFENQSTAAGMEWTDVTNTPTIDTTTFRTGAASLRATGWTSSTAEFLSYTMKTANAEGPFYLRTYLRIATMPAIGDTNRIMSFRTSGAADMVYINLLNSGALQLFDEDGQVGSNSSALTTGTWYRIEVKMDATGAGATDTVEAKIDGAAAFATSATRNLSSGVDKIVLGGNLGAAAITAGDWYFDDVAVNENVGTTQNGYPGAGGIIHLRPNAAGDTVTWTNTYTNIDETTPNDGTDSVTSTTLDQIEEANLTASGIASSDAVSVVHVGVRFNSSSTGVSAFKVRIKDGANTTPLESDNILNNSATWKTNVDTGPLKYPLTAYTRPDRGDAWTQTTLDTAIVGVRETVDTADTQAVTALWLVVDYYTPSIIVSGNAYADEATTAWVPCDGSTANISLVRNGGTAQTTFCADANGAYTFTVTGMSANDPISVFFNATDKGVAVTVLANVNDNITLNPRKNIAWVKGESASITNAKLDHCDSVSPAGCANVPYAVTTSNIVVEAGIELHIETSKTYAPAGNVTTPKMHVMGTYTGASETLTLSGTGTGTARPLYIDGGTFTASSNTTTFTGDGAADIESTTYNVLNLTPTITADRAYNFTTAALTVNGDFVINPTASSTTKTLTVTLGGNLAMSAIRTLVISGTTTGASNLNTSGTNYSITVGKIDISNLGSGGTLTANGSTITLTATSSTLLTQTGTFTAGTSTVVMNPDAAVTLTSNNAITFYNLSLTPAISTAGRTYTFGTSALTINGDFLIQPSGTQLLTVNPAANITVAAGKTTTISRTSTATSTLDLRPVSTDYDLSTGLLNIATGGTLDATSTASATLITLTGTSGTLFTQAGTFTITSATSTVVINGDGTATLTSNNAITFFNLTLNPTITAARTYTFGTSALTIDGDFTVNPSAGTAITLTVNLGAATTVAATKTTTLQGSGAGPATGKLDTVSGSSWELTSGFLNIASGGNLTAQDSFINLVATSGTLFTLNASGDLVAGTSKVDIESNANVTVTSGTFTGSDAFYILRLIPALSGGGKTYTLGSGEIAATSQLSISPSATQAAQSLLVNMGANLPLGGILTITGAGANNPTATLDTRPATTDYNITASRFEMNGAGGGTLDAGGSSSILTATGDATQPLFNPGSSGTFIQGTSEVILAPTSGSHRIMNGVDSVTFHKLTIDSTATNIRTGTTSNTITINNASGAALYIKNGVFNAVTPIVGPGAGNGTLQIDSGGTFCLGGGASTANATCDDVATSTTTVDLPVFQTYTFNAASTVRYLSNVAQTVDTTPTYGNLYLGPTITAARIYTFEAGTININGDFTIDPDAASALALTVNPAGNIVVAATKTTTITRTGSNATSLLDLQPVATDYNLTTGLLNVAAGGTLDAGSTISVITLTGTSGTLFTRAGTFTQGTSEVKATGAGNTTLLSAATTFHKLTVDNSGNTVSAGAGITINDVSGAALTLTTGKLNDGGNQITGPGGTNGTLSLAASTELCLGGNTSCTTSSTTATTLPTFNTYTVSATSTITYLANAAQAIAIDGAGWNYGNLKLAPVLATTGKTYTFDTGAVTVDGNFDVNPDAGSALALTVNMAGNITVATTKTTTITRTGANATSLLDTRPVATDYNVTTGTLTIEAGGTLDATGAASAITVSGNYTNNGTFTAGSSTVTLNGSAAQTLSGTLTGTSAFYNLTISNSSGTDASDCERTSYVASVIFAAAATSTNNYVITTASVRITYNSASTYTFTNINWNGQAVGTRIYFRNSAITGTWLLKVTGTQTAVSYVNVSRSDASVAGGSTIQAGNGTNVDCGNNTNWNFASPTFTQSAYRFGNNLDSTSVTYTSPTAPAQDTALNVISTGEKFRLRMLIHVATANLAISGQAFKLQFGERTAADCTSGVTWVDVATASGVIRYYDNVTPADGANLTGVAGDPAHGVDTTINQTYEEANNFTNSTAAINIGQDGMWDFSLTNNSSVGGKKYCFKAVKSDGTDLTTYTKYPEIRVDEELTFTLDATSKNFGNITAGSAPTDQTSTITTTTNASGGYQVTLWSTQLLTSGSFTIANWTGTNAAPTTLSGAGASAFGYNTNDSNLGGGTANRFTSAANLYAGFVFSGSGDRVADNTTGPISAEAFTITYRLRTSDTQAPGIYTSTLIYICTATY